MIKFSTVMILARTNADFGTLADWDLQKAPSRARRPGATIIRTCSAR